MLKCSASLWSANLGQLTREIKRVAPHTHRFHFDVADGHYVRALKFSPDLVRALRPASPLPFEAHLMVIDPQAWAEMFIEAGADVIIFDLQTARNPGDVIQAIKSKGKMAGVCLTLSHSIDEIEPYWKDLDIVSVAGTAPGDDQATYSPVAVDKVHIARELIFQHHWKTELEAEGGIVRETMPLLKAAGADYVVPGALMFDGSPRKLRQWLDTL